MVLFLNENKEKFYLTQGQLNSFILAAAVLLTFETFFKLITTSKLGTVLMLNNSILIMYKSLSLSNLTYSFESKRLPLIDLTQKLYKKNSFI